MLSFSHLIDNYWKSDERNFNSLINQEGQTLNQKLISIQSKREIFQILNLEELKLIIKDLYLRRSIFIHFIDNHYEFNNDELFKVYYKILKFKISKSFFNKKKVKEFIFKYINYLSSIIFLYSEEKDSFFWDIKNMYERNLMKNFSMIPENRYSEINYEAVNWYNHYFFNKMNNKNSGNRYESFLLHYVNLLNDIYSIQNKFYFKSYIIHEKFKIIENKKYSIKKRHKSNSIVLLFRDSKKPENIKVNFALFDYRIFLIIEFKKIFNKMNKNYEEEILKKIIKQATIELKKRNKIDNYFSMFDFLHILFSNDEIEKLSVIEKSTKKWFKDLDSNNYQKFIKKKIITAYIYNKLNLNISFSLFLKKYSRLKITEFLLYYFVMNEKKESHTFLRTWELFLKDYEEKNLNLKFLNFKIKRKININKNKFIYIVGTTKDFFKFYFLIKNKKHILRIAKRNRIKNNSEYSIKYVWKEIEKIILLKLLNKDENLTIVRKYEEVKENNKNVIKPLFHNYRNYIAHLGNGNENFFISYKDYVRKKWKVKEIIKNNDFYQN
ncbi:MAG: hypothetical protein HPAVJP_1580 [Candidatus Hepatoplasma vulgare]|nr:MAG: hypothetical protein HPAVJP_1580 [Candidatus Hepatoplasma sp.]